METTVFYMKVEKSPEVRSGSSEAIYASSGLPEKRLRSTPDTREVISSYNLSEERRSPVTNRTSAITTKEQDYQKQLMRQTMKIIFKLTFLSLRVLHLLDLFKYPLEVLRFLRSANFIHALQCEVWHTCDVFHLRLPDFLINLLPPFIALQPLPYFLHLQPCLHPSGLQRLVTRDIFLNLEITREQRFHDLRLGLRPLRLPQLNQPVRIPRIPRLPPKLEIYAHLLANSGKLLKYESRPLGTEFLLVVGALVDAGFGGVRVEVEGQPGGGEGVFCVGVGGAVGGDSAFEFVLADIAPGADGVADDGDGEVGHFVDGGVEGQVGWGDGACVGV